MKELPRPFDNDDDEAANEATVRLQQHVHNAATRSAQDLAVARWKQFIDHERDKRLQREK